MEFDFLKIEKKWQEVWERDKLFQVKEDSPKKKYYVLEMFPYPSGAGLHIGHALNYTIGDIYARFKMMNDFNVLHPMGFDALGLPAENSAIKAGVHPEEYTNNSIKNFVKQQRSLGLSYDWSRMIDTSDPEYYKWDQWIFLKMFENGLVYKKKSSVNWCPKCNSVLANEQVHNGRCWRHGDTEIEIKQLDQWFLKITDYAEELLDMIDDLDWPSRTKIMQKNWIGKSYGAEIDFKINGEKWSIFTTRPDTIFGVTFMVISAQHPRLMELVTEEKREEVENFLKRLKSVSEKELEEMEKEGVFTGSYAENPLTGELVPVYAGNFVVADYGSGMVMAVPAHDKRDYQFARKYGIDIKEVIRPVDYEAEEDRKKIVGAYVGEGTLINSGEFDGLDNKDAMDKIVEFLERKGLGRKKIQYKLRDWLISRQRYWGTPIPIINCKKCGSVPVKEEDLPVKLPKKVVFGKGNPLESNLEWLNVKCPVCGGEANRESDTMDTFVNSSWYFLRYCDPKNKEQIADKNKIDYWCPIDIYIGGAEHACMHLIYFRFYTKFLRDIGVLSFDEPAKKLFHQGMLHGADGNKMSKSLGNTIDPLEIIKKYGADSLRMALVSFASPDKDTNWDEKILLGSHKFLEKVYLYFRNVKLTDKSDPRLESKLNKTIKEVSKYIENFKYNLAIIKLRELFSKFSSEISKDTLMIFIKLLSPFCPHLAEELWEMIGEKDSVFKSNWPIADDKKIDEKLEKEEELSEKLASDINNILRLIREKGGNPQKVYVYVLPFEKEGYENNLEVISKKTGMDIEIFSVSDKNKYDPEEKAKRVKPGRPGIYIE